jgi:hypothetical protein
VHSLLSSKKIGQSVNTSGTRYYLVNPAWPFAFGTSAQSEQIVAMLCACYPSTSDKFRKQIVMRHPRKLFLQLIVELMLQFPCCCGVSGNM